MDMETKSRLEILWKEIMELCEKFPKEALTGKVWVDKKGNIHDIIDPTYPSSIVKEYIKKADEYREEFLKQRNNPKDLEIKMCHGNYKYDKKEIGKNSFCFRCRQNFWQQEKDQFLCSDCQTIMISLEDK